MSSPGHPGSQSNPYSSPRASGARPSEGAPGTGAAAVSEGTIEMLRQTKPWVRFLSVMGFLGAALLVLAGVFLMLVGGSGPGAPPRFLGIIYLPFGLLYIVPAVYLWRYADGIRDLIFGRRVEQLEDALQSQKSFWKFAGVMTLVVLVLYVVGILLALAMPLMVGARNAGS